MFLTYTCSDIGSALARVEKETRKLQLQFADLVDRSFDMICEKQVSVSLFTARLANLPIEHHEVHKEFFEKIYSEINKESTVVSIWLRLSAYWNFMNYSLLEQVICKFGDEERLNATSRN